MNKTFEEAEDLVYEIADGIESMSLDDTEIIVCPPYVFLELTSDAVNDKKLKIGAQNVHHERSGSYTGEVSAAMLQSMDIKYVIVGHSERRKYFHESGEMLFQKVRIAREHELTPIFCCGEQLEDRKSGKHFDVVKAQLEETVFRLDEEHFARVIIAYEPVWAIGTGETASPEQAQEMHACIRDLIGKAYTDQTAADTTILYGGSCNPGNAASLFNNPDVDGGLIGGASLKSADFLEIIKHRLNT